MALSLNCYIHISIIKATGTAGSQPCLNSPAGANSLKSCPSLDTVGESRVFGTMITKKNREERHAEALPAQ